MILGIQIMGIIFGISLLYFTFIHYKRKELTRIEYIFWNLVWATFVYLVLFPNSLDFIVESLQLVRTMDLFTIVGFMFLFFLTFYDYVANVQSRRKLERVVRAMALERAPKPEMTGTKTTGAKITEAKITGTKTTEVRRAQRRR